MHNCVELLRMGTMLVKRVYPSLKCSIFFSFICLAISDYESNTINCFLQYNDFGENIDFLFLKNSSNVIDFLKTKV
jgi:hypothetical protein